jgi:hypothetical protein
MSKIRIKNLKNHLNLKDLIRLKNNNYHKKQDAEKMDLVAWLKRE